MAKQPTRKRKNVIQRHTLLAVMTLALISTLTQAIIHHELAQRFGDYTVEASIEIAVAKLVGSED